MVKSAKYGSDQFLLNKTNSELKPTASLKTIKKEPTPKMHTLNLIKFNKLKNHVS